MFRRRLSLAFAFLAVAFFLQGALAWWAIESASAQVVRGRVASDVLQGHLQLYATKQRLRSLASRALLQDDTTRAERDTRLADMHNTLNALDALAHRAAKLDTDTDHAAAELAQRLHTLGIMHSMVKELEAALGHIKPLAAGADPAQALHIIDQAFDSVQGRDLRTLLAQTLAQERTAVDKERAAADRSLALVAGGVVSATVTITVLSVLLALHFARALRHPLQELSDGAQAIQRGDLAYRMTETRADEFAAVARTLNAMAVELQQHREREKRIRHDLEQQVQARTVELEQALEALKQNDASRRRLFADISHELRTPTTAIRGEAEIALRGQAKPTADYQDALGRIAETSKHLGQVIDDLLTMARSDAQSLSIHPKWVQAEQAVTEALSQVQPLAHERAVRLDWQREPTGDTPTALWADAPRLRQLLVLLLDNAIRYSFEGQTVTLTTGVSQDPEGAMWRAQVRDHGIGIPAQELPRVFERNFRGEDARRHRADGVGLGLPLAQALALAHGGRLALCSTAAHGNDRDQGPGEGHGEGPGVTATLLIPVKQPIETHIAP